jgi:hypothetical protein
MPTRYIKPEGSRKLEFWKITNGGETSAFINVPEDWTDIQIKYELEDWGYIEDHYHVRYGWNDEKDFGSRS